MFLSFHTRKSPASIEPALMLVRVIVWAGFAVRVKTVFAPTWTLLSTCLIGLASSR
jgi:hypothetical protein